MTSSQPDLYSEALPKKQTDTHGPLTGVFGSKISGRRQHLIPGKGVVGQVHSIM